jgi:hypothetical protein
MIKKVRIFDYKDNVAINMDVNAKYINDPTSPGQLGTVISTNDISISKGAKEIIAKAKKGGGSFSELMLTKHSVPDESGKSSIGVMGFGKVHLGKNFEIGRTCDVCVLDDCLEEELDVPEDYKEYIDSL